MKNVKTIWMMIMVVALSASCWAMGNRSSESSPGRSVVNTANQMGNNDALQQMAGDAGEGVANYGKWLSNDGWDRHLNQGATKEFNDVTQKNAVKLVGYGKGVEYAGKAAPHVGWMATSAGRYAEGDYSGAAIEGVNGCGRSVFVSKCGAAAGIWAGAKVGALAGSWGGPLGAGAGFVIGAGAAWVAGLGWDNTVGAGANALDQRVADWNANNQYAGQGNRSGGASGSWDYNPGNDQSITGGNPYDDPGVAGGTPNIGRDAARDAAQQSRQAMPRPVHRPSAPCRGDGRCR